VKQTLDTGNGNWLTKYLLHLLVVALMAMAGSMWLAMGARVNQIDLDGTREGRERIAIAETRLMQLETSYREVAARQQRIEDKIDVLLLEVRRLN
jgi:hypothetical protein